MVRCMRESGVSGAFENEVMLMMFILQVKFTAELDSSSATLANPATAVYK